MALTKTVEDDRIEVVTEYKYLQIRTATVIKDDGVEISRSFHRKSIGCGKLDNSGNFVERDVSGESTDVKNIANVVWTQSVKDAYKAKLLADKAEREG